MANKLKVGVIGCGNISDSYLEHARDYEFMEIVACSDLLRSASQAKAEKYELKDMSVSELLADNNIFLVINLTTPQAHAVVNKQILEAGKHAYCEKPFGLNRKEAEEILELAEKKNLLVGCAPDTFLGEGQQLSRKVIDENWIGQPIAGTAFMMCGGHESWHPNAGFYYLKGGGPVLDMGPYYFTTLVNMLGPVESVSTMVSRSGDRIATSDAMNGQILSVEVNTHVTGLIKFKTNPIITFAMSFDVINHECPHIQIHGTKGSMNVPDPNTFKGPVKLANLNTKGFNELPYRSEFKNNWRGLGVADMVLSLIEDYPHRASGKLAYHVLDVMLSLEDSAEQKKELEVKSTCERPLAMPVIKSTGKSLISNG